MNDNPRRNKNYFITPMTAAEKTELDERKILKGKLETRNIVLLFNPLQESIKINAMNHMSLETKINAMSNVEEKLEELKTQNVEIRGLVGDIEAKIHPVRIDNLEESAKSAVALSERNSNQVESLKEDKDNNKTEMDAFKEEVKRLSNKNLESESQIRELKNTLRASRNLVNTENLISIPQEDNTTQEYRPSIREEMT